MGLLLLNASRLEAADVVWQEDFESNLLWDRWHVEGGVWAVTAPTTGPTTPHGGTRCAATAPNGDYPSSADARLVRDETFVVHPAALQPRLRFWHWNSNYPEDPCTVEVKPAGGEWQTISREYVWRTSVWSRTTLDLSEFAGQSVIIAFRFRSNDDTRVSAGWYVDDIEYVTGLPVFNIINNPERFDNGLGDWNVDGGDWEVRMPPKYTEQYNGWGYKYTSCAGTVLTDPDENDARPTVYHAHLDSRLISPEFTVPPAADYPRLRFWQLTDEWLGDTCRVEIRTQRGSWQPLSPDYPYSFIWTPATLDLRAFADQKVQIAFRLKSNCADCLLEQTCWGGWYVDDVEVVTGKPAPLEFEGFEAGYGDWEIEGWLGWQVGPPLSWAGPGKTPFGRSCAGAWWGCGAYRDGRRHTRLVSPEFEVPAASEYPRLRFWHWFAEVSCVPAAPCVVEVRTANGDWRPLSREFTHVSRAWTRTTLDLRPLAGQTVRIGFRAEQSPNDFCRLDWYIDNVEVVKGKPPEFSIVNHPERFDGGLGEWNVTAGDWEVGRPTVGPAQPFSEPFCAGTVLDGNHDPLIDTMLVSPEFVLPPASEHPRLRFWHWCDTSFASAEPEWAGGRVCVGQGGAFVSNPAWPTYTGTGHTWTRATLDLSAYAGQTVQVAFAFRATGDMWGAGWYVDDVEVVTGRTDFSLVNNAEGFESGLGEWEAVPATWQVGEATVGPLAAFKGNSCAGTVLGGNYDPNTDARLVSPEFVVPCAEAEPRLRFAHWYKLGSGDSATVEVRELPGDAWTPAGETYTGSGGDWSTAVVELALYAGKCVQLAFRLGANGDSSVGPGWYVDEVRIQANLADPLPDRQVVEGEPLSFLVNTTCRNVRFRLGAEAPSGAMLDPDLGIFTWLPDACQGPGVYFLKIILVDPACDLPLGFLTNAIEVLDVNPPPIMGLIPPLAIRAGVPVELRVADYVYDLSCPAQQLTYTLDSGSPTNASIASLTGQLSWTPSLQQACRTNLIHVRATDDGSPPLSATTTVLAYPVIQLGQVKLAASQVEIIAEGGSPGAYCELWAASHLLAVSTKWTVLDRRAWPESGPIVFWLPIGEEPTRYIQMRVSAPQSRLAN